MKCQCGHFYAVCNSRPSIDQTPSFELENGLKITRLSRTGIEPWSLERDVCVLFFCVIARPNLSIIHTTFFATTCSSLSTTHQASALPPIPVSQSSSQSSALPPDPVSQPFSQPGTECLQSIPGTSFDNLLVCRSHSRSLLSINYVRGEGSEEVASGRYLYISRHQYWLDISLIPPGD